MPDADATKTDTTTTDGTANATVTAPAKPSKPAEKADEPTKLTLTQAELEERVKAATDAAIKAREEAEAEQKRKDKEAADAAEAKRRGDWEKLHGDEKARADKAEAELATAKLAARGRDVDVMLRDHLAEKHPEYAGVAKYIRPLLTFDAGTKDETIAKQIEAEAAAYVKANPRQPRAAAGAPPAIGGQRVPRPNGAAAANRMHNVGVAGSRF